MRIKPPGEMSRGLIFIEGFMDYNKFPLSALVKQARKFEDFKDFDRFYGIEIYHGYYWHLTENPDFKISDQIGPRDMSSMSDGGISEKGALMVTSDLEYWDSHYNTDPRSWKRKVKRNFAVLFDASDIEPHNLRQVSRGFGNEVYIDSQQVSKLKQIGVYSIKYAKSLDKKFHSMIPQSKEELYELWQYANQDSETIQNLREFVRRTLMRENLNEYEMDININNVMKGYIDAALWTEEDNLRNQQEPDEDSDENEYDFGFDDDDDDDDEEETELDKLIKMQNSFRAQNIDTFTKEHIGADSLIQAYLDIKKFLASADKKAIEEAVETNGEERLGHDIWLTRNGHGAGFFDHTYEPENEKSLMYAAKKLGEVYIYIDENGMLRFSNEN